MQKVNKALLFLLLSLNLCADEGVVNGSYIKEHLTKQGVWASLHGASGEDLGAGMLYYGLVYAMKAKTCVCLGSGDGFVPRVLRQAQRDLRLEGAKTILIDGNVGKWCRPNWLPENSALKREFPEIEIILSTTAEAAKQLPLELKIDYLHIDADRSIRGALQDFLDYLPFMAKNGIILLHDTGPKAPCSPVVALIAKLGYPAINLTELGTGIAMFTLNKNEMNQ